MTKDGTAIGRPLKAASIAEISAAIDALTAADTERFEQMAVNRIVRIGRRAANGRTSDDLLQESLRRILDQSRTWHPGNVPFVPFVIGVIYSVASEWAGHRKRNLDSPEYADLESETIKEREEGDAHSPFEGLATPTPTPEDELIMAEFETEQAAMVGEIEKHFAEDDNAATLLMGWEEGMDGPAIRKEFGFSETLYDTTVRRIKRQSRKLMEKRNGG
jgi:DNA-directed RNA polymerase specialized sigma24 family protein